jgi:hypothetical protein
LAVNNSDVMDVVREEVTGFLATVSSIQQPPPMNESPESSLSGFVTLLGYDAGPQPFGHVAEEEAVEKAEDDSGRIPVADEQRSAGSW